MKKILLLIFFCQPIWLYAAGNAELGAVKVVSCAACHGESGISPLPNAPNLAGQHEGYLLKQLEDMKAAKTRVVPTMTAMLTNLSTKDMEDIAAFYAKQTLTPGVTDAKYLSRGELLYRGGDFDKHITACIACHGPRGTGNAQANFPVLSGQHPLYTVAQLQAFKDKKRNNDLNEIMRTISARMSEEDMQAVANYVAGLH